MPYTATLEFQNGTVHSCTIPDGGGWSILRSATNPDDQTLLVRVRERAAPQGLVEARVSVSNGLYPNPCGAIYYRSLRLEHSTRKFMTWARAGSSTAGRTLWLVNMGAHFIRPRQILERRFVTYQTSADRAAALALLRYQGAQIPAKVESFGPYRVRVPVVDRARYAQYFRGVANEILAADLSGLDCYVPDFARTSFVGPYPVEGSPGGAEGGGYRIVPTLQCPEQCWPGLLARALLLEHSIGRSFCALHDRSSGEVVRDEARLVPWDQVSAAGTPGLWNQEPAEFLEGPSSARRYKFYNSGSCNYAQALWEWRGDDLEHRVRALVVGLPLVEFCGDEGVVDFVELLAQTACSFRWSNRADRPTLDTAAPGTYVPPSLRARLVEVAREPGRGHSSLTREFAWTLASGLAAWKYGRGDWAQWVDAMAMLAWGAQQPCGLFCRDSNTYFPPNATGAMAFHEALVACALGGAWRARPDALLPGMLRRWVESIQRLPARDYYGGGKGPGHNLATMVDGVPLQHLDDAHAYGEGDPAHVLAANVTCAEVCADPSLLLLQLPYWLPAPSLAARRAQVREVFPCKDQTADVEAALEQQA